MHILYKNEITEPASAKEIVDTLLKERGVEDREVFITPPSPLSFTLKDFGFNKKDTNQLIHKLNKVYESHGSVVVYTDYDADGITGGAVLWETLHLLGFRVMPYVPDRTTEGYGFSIKGLKAVKKKFNPDLIISVDHGITAIKQIAYAKNKLGISVIVTDHHHKQKQLPTDAELIIHIPSLSGSGVAYFVAKEIYQQLKVKSQKSKVLENYFHTDYPAIASIGTIADLVPLVGASRALVAHGLQAFSRMKRVGLTHLLRQADIEGKPISPYEVGFIIAPRINAIGRLDHAIDALRLICTTDSDRALRLAQKIGDINVRRQDLVRTNIEEAEQMVEQLIQHDKLPHLIILSCNHWHEGVIGLIAGSLAEKYYRPTIIMTKGENHYKASVRSIYGFHVTEFLSQLASYLVSYGGHAAAAGFSLLEENHDIFIAKAQALASEHITPQDLERRVLVDIKMPVSLITKALYLEIKKLSPFGVGNARPVFASEVQLVHAAVFGKTKTHLKLQVKGVGNASPLYEMIAFGKADLFQQLSKNQTVLIVYQIDINIWNGKESLRGLVKHIEL